MSLRLILLGFLLVTIVFVVINLPSFQDQMERKMTSIDSLTTTSSVSLRLLRGYYCFGEIDGLRKLIGCGYNGFFYYYTTFNITTIYDANLTFVSYMSGFFSALCDIGIIGFTLLFGYLLFETIKSKKRVCYALLFVLILLLLGSDLFESPVYFIVVLFLLSISKTPKKSIFIGHAYFNYSSRLQ